jgi:hypothetical protein
MEADVCCRKNTNSFDLVIEEAYCRIVLVSQHGGVLFVNFVLQTLIL